jgi:hypothetical protein
LNKANGPKNSAVRFEPCWTNIRTVGGSRGTYGLCKYHSPGGFLWRSSPDAGDVGYYRGEEENPWTFNEIDAGRYSICGERALIEADGMLNGLGRVSICIDDVGEQAYPEEVEDSVQPPDDVMNSL